MSEEHKVYEYKEGYMTRMEATRNSWNAMIRRCSPEATGAGKKYYYDRGIRVCYRWRISFKTFLKHMGLRPEGKTLDRINNYKGYNKENCRWATPTEQANNRRPRQSAEHLEIEMVLALAEFCYDPPGDTAATAGTIPPRHERTPG